MLWKNLLIYLATLALAAGAIKAKDIYLLENNIYKDIFTITNDVRGSLIKTQYLPVA